MNKLEGMRAKFKGKTERGHEFDILEVYTDSMQVLVKNSDLLSINRWVLCLYDLEGKSLGTTSNLVPIKPVIDYSKLPVDVLCEAPSKTGGKLRRYSDGRGGFFTVGKDSGSVENKDHAITLDYVEIIDNPIRANIGNTLALLPDNINLRVWTRGNNIHNGHSQTFRGWSDIIHYRILGES